MELCKNTADAFINYLKAHGYPEECIVLEWGNNKCAFDIAIMDDDNVTPIAFFEIKSKRSPQSIKMGINHLRRAYKMLNISAPCSLVFGTDNAPFFEVMEVSDIVCTDDPVDIDDFLNANASSRPMSYNNVKLGAYSKRLARQAEKRKERFDKIKPLCWILFPVIACIILVLDAFKLYCLTTHRLIVLGVVVAIILLPFFSEFTIKDISFIRKKEGK